MNEPTDRIAGIRQQTRRIDDPNESTLVTTIAVSLAYAGVWVVERTGATRFIGRSLGTGKVDSASAEYYADGTVRLWVSAADVGGGGATSHTAWFDFPAALEALDYHLKTRIYERVTNPETATHQAIEAMIAEAQL